MSAKQNIPQDRLINITSDILSQELYLAFNHIEDVSPVSMLDQLEILDLEG